ncbi:choice-of-anchor J domain-containing protein [Ekhidna sp.]|uniref:choice-of-anchor J domain-containing protein n=1 Tax=Ekhidna sp. TaxID=2608089 RepID=UPI003BAC1C7F
MKKLNIYSLIIALLAVVVISCNPLQDDIDQIEQNLTIVKDVEYTLTDDDYETLDEICGCTGFGNFGSEEDVKANVPTILAEQFPALGLGSSAVVTYDFFRGFNDDVDVYLDVVDDLRYELGESDYAVGSAEAGDAGFFNNTVTFEDNVTAILNAGVSSPTDGQIVAVTYEKSDLAYSDINFTSAYSEDYTSITDLSASSFQLFDLEGTQDWHKYVSSYPYEAARMSGFSSGNQPNTDWMITPAVDLTGFDDAELRIQHVLNFLGDGVFGTDIAIRVSTDYDEVDPATATWEDLTFDVEPAGDSWDPVDSKASLAAYADETIYISFYYKSTADYAPNWRVIDIAVLQGEEVEKDTYNEFYTYNSATTSWSAIDYEDAYFVSDSDYKAFGLSAGYFTSSDRAENYLPGFLSKTLRPFAQEDDTQIVIYDYVSSSSGAQVRGDFYTFTGGEWVEYASTIEASFNFGFKEEGWVADNTIKVSFGTADYTWIVDNFTGVYNGASNMAQFGNFSCFNWTEAEKFDVISSRLEVLYPSIEEDPQPFKVTYSEFCGATANRVMTVVYSGGEWTLESDE